ncbi:transglutaminase family protein [Infirmifilum lucidum]|uniref:Transglutaminase family protein n=1 Tax=Infirmifilum lucidum TaxID=2776706 RepID=A0A7L9FEP9_9CREN|nr:transglutaminase family protein [Infirmifilum lucidum]QOJ78278.1 transglutaminase family protein [Infirmifilum lucidum]
MRLRNVFTVFAGVLLVLQSIQATKYVVVTSLVVEGRGTVDREVFSRIFLIAPDIPGWQNSSRITLYVNSKERGFTLSRDADGNLYAYPGDLQYSGRINITLVQEVEVLKSPFRRVADLPETVAASRALMDKTASSVFWRCNASGKKFSDVVSLASSIGSGSPSNRDFVLRAADWVRRNIKYSLNISGGVRCPAETLARAEGACGDIHALYTALLRVRGIDSYLAYAYVYVPEESFAIEYGKWRYVLVGAEPHIFTVVNSSGAIFPVDLTANTQSSLSELARGSAVNQLDSVIVVAWIKNRDPNDLLAVYAPTGAEKVELVLRVVRGSAVLNDNTLLFLAILLAGALILNKERST